MPNPVPAVVTLLAAIVTSPIAIAQYVLVSPARGVSVCNAASQRIIKVAPESLVNGVLQLVVTKTNAQCGAGGTFGNPQTLQGGRIDVHEGSTTGPIVASMPYEYGVGSVRVEVRPAFEIQYRDYYAVVGSDTNLYWDGPVKVRSFDVARTAGGVKLYKLEPDPAQPGSMPDFVVEVNLSVARIRSLLGAETGAATSGATSTRSKVVARRNVAQHWEEAKRFTPPPFIMFNFAFFTTEATKTIAFPLKVDGRVVSYGYEFLGGATGGGQWAGKYRYLAFDNGQNTVSIGTINHTSPATLASADQLTDSQAGSAGQEFLGGLSRDACIDCLAWRPRTFLSTVDRTGDGRAELLIFSSERATNDYATRILQHFKGSTGAMLQADGGGSAHLVVADGANSTYFAEETGATITVVAGKILVRGEAGRARSVPHVLAIYPDTP